MSGALHARDGSAFGKTDWILLRSDKLAGYPVVASIPVLMVPEIQTPVPRDIDLRDPRWAEAYNEMDYYNQSADDFAQSMDARVAELERCRGADPLSFAWIDAPYDAASQVDAMNHLGAPASRVILQLGGMGLHAVKALIAGAAESWLITPMHSEAQYALELGRRLGVADRLHAVVGVAEQLPFGAGTFDAIYAGGCLHHMAAEYAAAEIGRVLVAGGRFAAVEPWQTVLHKWGTRMLGKREPNAYCRPLNAERLRLMCRMFEQFEVRSHGPLLRYAALAWLKLSKRPIRPVTGLRMTRLDDRLPLPARLGGSVAILATKAN
ncbi:methyltransferase domain-containing protein [Actinopolymorpha sp. B17G11]|uniref:class I SAM-dependent methyltransferase n=1 Tax=Actinopolymorpha sp. B17G11 TaxID=3160861 RepID=UPI0032E4B53F